MRLRISLSTKSGHLDRLWNILWLRSFHMHHHSAPTHMSVPTLFLIGNIFSLQPSQESSTEVGGSEMFNLDKIFCHKDCVNGHVIRIWKFVSSASLHNEQESLPTQPLFFKFSIVRILFFVTSQIKILTFSGILAFQIIRVNAQRIPLSLMKL